ncbi:MAG: hypothetical protein LBI69_02115 [Puniceicoccales bacterium]|nr:hypothetical protein [Puniceicoccales bacterium]
MNPIVYIDDYVICSNSDDGMAWVRVDLEEATGPYDINALTKKLPCLLEEDNIKSLVRVVNSFVLNGAFAPILDSGQIDALLAHGSAAISSAIKPPASENGKLIFFAIALFGGGEIHRIVGPYDPSMSNVPYRIELV